MALYEAGMITSSALNNVASADIVAGARGCRLYELFFSPTVTAQTTSLGRPANDGSQVQTSAQFVQAEQFGDPVGLSTIATTWSTAPTKPLVFMRTFANGAGGGVIWSFPRGLILQPGRGLCTWNVLNNSVGNYFNVTVEE